MTFLRRFFGKERLLMKIAALILILSVIQFGCRSDAAIKDLNDRISALENRKISSETAILVAKGELSNHVDLKSFEVTGINEGIDYWEVRFISKCRDCLDNQPSVVVNKTSGEVVRFYRYGEPAK
jgi:hypothetical protein